MENCKYGLYADISPTKQQLLFEAVKNKAVKCADRTQLCAAIYPWILELIKGYVDKPYNRQSIDSFQAEIYDFKRAIAVYLSAIPLVISPATTPLDLERMRDEALDAAIEMAVNIANIEVHQCSIGLSVIMANFVADL